MEEKTTKERVEQELEELNEKIVKLTGFLFGKQINNKGLSQEMIRLMKEQLQYMQRYAEIIQSRLLIWDKTDEDLREHFKNCCY